MAKPTSYKLSLTALAGLLALLLPAVALAAITQTFKTDSALIAGSIVSLTNQNSDTVTPATKANVQSLLGVVTEVSGNNAQVATSGVVHVLVSNVNGDIAVGSPVTVSGVAGVGEKAVSSAKIIGLAQAAFSAQTPGAVSQSVTDKLGRSQQYFFGSVPIVVGVGDFAPSDATSAFLPPAIQSFFSNIAGRSVPPVRTVISLILMLVTTFIVGIIINTSVHSSLISIGRNPLAGGTLLKSLLQVLAVSIALMGATLGVVYLLITH